MAKKALLCPFCRDKDGNPAKCGNWCGVYMEAKKDDYSCCSIRHLSWNVGGISYNLKNGPGGSKPSDDVPF